MKTFVRVLICLLLVGFGVNRVIFPHHASAAPKKEETRKPSGQKANAKQLLAAANKALGATIKAARADKALDPKTPKNKPFWKSLHVLAKELKAAQAGLASKNDNFFKGIADARKAEEQMKIDWQLTDSKNKAVIDGGKKLGHALAILRTDFSKETDRKKKGGELTAKEKAEFGKIKAQQKELLTKIAKLEKAAKKDKALEKGLREIQARAQHIIKEPETVDAYIATLFVLDELVGMIRGYDYYVDKEWRADWIVLEKWTETYEATYAEIVSSESYEWAEVETSVDIAESESVDVSEEVSESEISAEENYAESESFDMSEAEEDEVASEEDTDAEVASDGDSMEDASDSEGEDMSDEGDSGDDGGDEGD